MRPVGSSTRTGGEVEADDEAAREVVAPEQEGAAAIDAEFKQANVLVDQAAEVFLVVTQVMSVRELVRVVTRGIQPFPSRSHFQVNAICEARRELLAGSPNYIAERIRSPTVKREGWRSEPRYRRGPVRRKSASRTREQSVCGSQDDALGERAKGRYGQVPAHSRQSSIRRR
jgi:hypothetical protein